MAAQILGIVGDDATVGVSQHAPRFRTQRRWPTSTRYIRPTVGQAPIVPSGWYIGAERSDGAQGAAPWCLRRASPRAVGRPTCRATVLCCSMTTAASGLRCSRLRVRVSSSLQGWVPVRLTRSTLTRVSDIDSLIRPHIVLRVGRSRAWSPASWAPWRMMLG